MKKTVMALSLVIVVGLSSCISSLNPLITYTNIECFDAAIGMWKDDDAMEVKIEKFHGSGLEREFQMQEKKDSEKKGHKPKPLSQEEIKYQNNVYILSFIKNGVQHVMILSFTRINSNLFAQFAPLIAFEENKKSYDAGLIIKNDTAHRALWDFGKDQTFSFAKVKLNAGQLQFIPFNGDYMQTLLAKGAVSIPFEEDRWFDTTLITASADQLQKFFHKYGNDERLFNKKHTLVFKPTVL